MIKEAFEIAGAVILSLGGGSAIVWGLSSWLGKVWANRILESEKVKCSKQIEEYKAELEKSISKINAEQDKRLYISKTQYDNEYKIYQNIWAKLNNCVLNTIALYPGGIENVPVDEKEKEEYQMDKHKKYVQAYNEFSRAIQDNAPFYTKKFYESFVSIRTDCSSIGDLFFYYEWDIKYNLSYALCRGEKMTGEERREMIETRNRIVSSKDALQDEIREYLSGLRLQE